MRAAAQRCAVKARAARKPFVVQVIVTVVGLEARLASVGRGTRVAVELGHRRASARDHPVEVVHSFPLFPRGRADRYRKVLDSSMPDEA